MLALLLTAFPIASAQAGTWKFTVTGTMTASTIPTSTQPPYNALPLTATGTLTLPAYYVVNMYSVPQGQTTTLTADMNLVMTVTPTWVANTQLPSDPAPAVLRVSEGASTRWSAGGDSTVSTTGSTASDGLGDPCVNGTAIGTSAGSAHIRSLLVTNGICPAWTLTLSAHTVMVVTGPLNGGQAVANATLVSYTVSAQPPGVVKVDQDQQVFAPAATEHFSATLSNISGFTVDWVKISVDGAAPLAATMTVGYPNSYYINWPASAALNPSEHTVEATAQVHDAIGTVPLDSTASVANDRLADDIIADVRLQSLTFNNSIALMTDATTAVPSPQYTWNPATNALLSSNPAAYIQGSAVNLTMALGSSAGAALTGTTPIGYALKLQANPNTTGPAVGNPPVTPPPDPTLTLYDNTTGTPFVPTVCTSSATVSVTTVLDAWVAKYTTTIPALNFYVQFTKVTPAVWRMVNSYGSASLGQPIYAVVATPTAPMVAPWTGVLDDACVWAARTTNPTSATTALCNNFYGKAYYNPTQQWYTSGSPETFFLQSFLNKTLGVSSAPSGLQGQCNDFADFLVCLNTSIGAKAIQAQHSNSGFWYSHVIYAGTTTTHTPVPDHFAYHQWTTDGTITSGNVFDSAVRPDDNSTPPVNEALSSYLSWLSPGSPPTGQTPFIPTIAN